MWQSRSQLRNWASDSHMSCMHAGVLLSIVLDASAELRMSIGRAADSDNDYLKVSISLRRLFVARLLYMCAVQWRRVT